MKTLLLTATACVLAASGCVENDQSMKILRFVPINVLGACVADPQSLTLLSMGILDTHIVQQQRNYQQQIYGYVAAPIVENELVDTSAMTGIQHNDIDITGFDVELHRQDGSAFPASVGVAYHVPSSGGVIHPGQGRTAPPTEVIPAATAAALDPIGRLSETIVVRIRPVGTRDSGTLVGAWVDLPVQLCSNCLSPTSVDLPCPSKGYPAAMVANSGCFPQQDYPMTCCTSTSSPMRMLCGSAVPLSM